MGYLDILPYTLKLFYKRRSMPIYLIHFVTERCTAKCDHCLCGQGLGSADELTIDEIENFSAKAGRLLFVFLTGGEPFLRNDLAEIAYLYYRNNGVQKFQIPSNGSLTDKCLETMEQMLPRCPGAHFSVTISLDALGEAHDRSRHHPGLFDKAVRTFKALQELEKRFPNYNTNVTITFSATNQDVARDVFLFAKDKLGARNIFNTLVRGQPRQLSTLNVDLDKFDALNEALDKALTSREMAGYTRFPLSHFVDAKNLISRRLISRMAREKRYLTPCYAGQLAMVLHPDGKVFPCELRDDCYGDLRENDYDLKRIWFSSKAKASRRDIRENRCFCTHECFVTMNLLFNPTWFPRLLAKYAQLRWYDKK